MSKCNCKEEIDQLRKDLISEIRLAVSQEFKVLAASESAAALQPAERIATRQMSLVTDVSILRTATAKQHAALQMWLFTGMNIAAIARRMKCAPNTARHHLRGLWNRFDETDKNKIARRLLPVWDEVTEAEYIEWSGGLPKDWSTTYVRGVEDASTEDDPYAYLYIKSKGVIDGGET
jgi:hypothetical protein